MFQHEFVVAIRILLGTALFPDSPDMLSGDIIDTHGDHLLGFGYDSAHSRHHKDVCDIIWNALLVNNKAARRERHVLVVLGLTLVTADLLFV